MFREMICAMYKLSIPYALMVKWPGRNQRQSYRQFSIYATSFTNIANNLSSKLSERVPNISVLDQNKKKKYSLCVTSEVYYMKVGYRGEYITRPYYRDEFYSVEPYESSK